MPNKKGIRCREKNPSLCKPCDTEQLILEQIFQSARHTQDSFNPCPAEPVYALPLQTV